METFTQRLNTINRKANPNKKRSNTSLELVTTVHYKASTTKGSTNNKQYAQSYICWKMNVHFT